MSDITDERMATALERIADALERAHPAKSNPGGLVQPPWDIASVEPVPNQPGVFRKVTHAAWDDCERPADPLDESDHRPRHMGREHLWWHGEGHWHTWADARCFAACRTTLEFWLETNRARFTFCDCPDDDETIEAENGATD